MMLWEVLHRHHYLADGMTAALTSEVNSVLLTKYRDYFAELIDDARGYKVRNINLNIVQLYLKIGCKAEDNSDIQVELYDFLNTLTLRQLNLVFIRIAPTVMKFIADSYTKGKWDLDKVETFNMVQQKCNRKWYYLLFLTELLSKESISLVSAYEIINTLTELTKMERGHLGIAATAMSGNLDSLRLFLTELSDLGESSHLFFTLIGVYKISRERLETVIGCYVDCGIDIQQLLAYIIAKPNVVTNRTYRHIAKVISEGKLFNDEDDV